MTVQELKEKVFAGEDITKEEALFLLNADLEEISKAADEIRKKYCGNGFDICSIINGKSGHCSEDCKFCAQAGCYQTGQECYPLVSTDTIMEGAKKNAKEGALRFAVVTSGKRLSEEEIDRVCQSLSEVHKEVPIELCASFGLLEEKDFIKLKEAGVTRVHNNLESSRSYFEKMCSTHTYDEKIKTIKAAQKVGLSVCSGGLMGIGESTEDRVDMAMTLRELGITSVPVNMLSPIKGTPLGEQKCLTEDDMRRIVAVYRFILPKASIRLAGGRGLMEHYGMTCFTAGSNATITGTLLTTAGVTSKEDMETIKSLGYEPRLWND